LLLQIYLLRRFVTEGQKELHKMISNSCAVVAQLAFIAKEALELSIMTAKALLSLVAWSG
jgi:hypothetical protein